MTRKERSEYRERIKAQVNARREKLQREDPEKFGALRASRRKGPRKYPPLPTAKACTRCGTVKPATREFFGPANKGRLKLNTRCKECAAAEGRRRRREIPGEREKQVARAIAATKRRRDRDPEAWRAAHNRHSRELRRRQRADPVKNELMLAKQRVYRKANWDRVKRYACKSGPLAVMYQMMRYAAKLKRTPAWADHEAIRKFYEEARRLTEATGIEHNVDHVVPLRGRHVSGLHVETNLQVITAEENKRKANRFIPT